MEGFKAIENESIKGATIEFSKKSGINSAYHSTFEDCELILDSRGMPSYRGGARFGFASNKMVRCTIVAKGKVLKLNLVERSELTQCNFVGGPFVEPQFGSGILSDSEDVERLHECDFTECDLRDAIFYRVSVNQLKLPGWPHISVVARDGGSFYAAPSVRPARTLIDDAVDAFDWDDKEMALSLRTMVIGMGVGSYLRSIIVCHADDLVRRGAHSREALKAALDRFAHPALRY